MPAFDITLKNLIDPTRRAFAQEKIRSVMIWPDDKKAREKFHDRLLANRLKAAEAEAEGLGRFMVVAPQAFKRARLAPSTVKLRKMMARTLICKTAGDPGISRGDLAGYIVLAAWGLSKSGQPRTGLLALMEGIANLIPDCKGLSQRSWDGLWKTYAAVAPLWAANYICDSGWDDEGPDPVDRMLSFIRVAEAFRRFGESYQPRNTKDTFLLPHAETWKFPVELVDGVDVEITLTLSPDFIAVKSWPDRRRY